VSGPDNATLERIVSGDGMMRDDRTLARELAAEVLALRARAERAEVAYSTLRETARAYRAANDDLAALEDDAADAVLQARREAEAVAEGWEPAAYRADRDRDISQARCLVGDAATALDDALAHGEG
jgi:hypothetical protein